MLLVNLLISQNCLARAMRLGLKFLGRRLQAGASRPGFGGFPASFGIGTSLLAIKVRYREATAALVIVEILSARHFVFDSRKLNEFVFNYNRS